MQDDEPFTLDWEGWRSVSERLLPLMLHDEDQGRIELLAAAGHEFPDGKPGEVLRRRELSRLNEFAAVVRPAITEISPEPLPFTLDFVIDNEAWRLMGTLTGLNSCSLNCLTPAGIELDQTAVGTQASPPCLLRYRCDDTRPADYLATWFSHLALCAISPTGMAVSSRCLSLNGEFSFSGVANAREIFIDLLACYQQGLCQPLHFFPKSAWAFITSNGNRQMAKNRWQCSDQRPNGEAADPYYRLALRGEADPLTAEFEALARRIYGPLVEHLTDSRLKKS